MSVFGGCLLFLVFNFYSIYGYSSDTLKTKYIVVIGVDGLSAWSIKHYKTPVLDSLMEEGTYSLHAKAVYPTLSSPNWASMIMGVRPKKHGIKSNHWTHTDRNAKKSATIFKLIKDQHPGVEMIIINHWKEFENLLESDCKSFVRHASGENSVITLAAENLKYNKPHLSFIHLDHVDSCGHHFGHKSKQYKKAVLKTDSLIGAFINVINRSDLKGNVTLLITSDHGFWGKHHGSISRKEKNIPWIIVGPEIKKGYKLKKQVKTYDTASMLAYFFQIEVPDYWEGRIIKEAFLEY